VTEPILGWYEGRGILVSVAAERPVEDVTREVLVALEVLRAVVGQVPDSDRRSIDLTGPTPPSLPRQAGTRALLRCTFPEQRRSMIQMLGWVQMANARSLNATWSLWQLGTLVAMS